MSSAKMKRVIVHWTAGTYKPNSLDLSDYHILIDGDGKPIRGKPSILLNEAPLKKGYAPHTLNCNTSSIGVSLCCMKDAMESPFEAGDYPMRREQWEAMTQVVAELCKTYRIPVTMTTVLSHAEVQSNLGIKQRGKWDIARLAFDPSVRGARACGDKLRAEVSEALLKL